MFIKVGDLSLEKNISVEVIKEKSFDPNFLVRVSYDDGKIRFKNEVFSVLRRPPKVKVEYPVSVENMIENVDVKKIELEIMRAIVDTLLSNSKKRL